MSDRLDWRVGTLIDVLADRARSAPDAVVYTFLADGDGQEKRLTHAQLDRRARALARLLQRMTQPGDRALLLYPDGLEYISGLFGCLYAGLVPVSGVPPLVPRSVERFVNVTGDCNPAVVLGTRAVLSEFQAMARGQLDPLALRWVPTDRLDERGAEGWERPGVTNESVALLQYTSGSTGSPRGVLLTHGNLLHNLEGQIVAFGYDAARDSGVSWLPFSHDMGLIGAVLMALYGGGHCVLLSAVHFVQQPIRWLRAIARYGATISGGPNFAYDLCVRRITAEQKKDLDLSTWAIAFNGAETVRAATLRRFAEAFRDCGFRPEAIYPCYGLAEATLFVAGGTRGVASPTMVVGRDDLGRGAIGDACRGAVPGSVDRGPEAARVAELVACGRSMAGQQIVIVRPLERVPCEPGEIGEIWVSGPSVARGYLNRDEETRDRFHARLLSGEGPYLRTGDLGCMREGDLFVTGRMKHLIIIRGTNYYPQDIEATAEASHDALRPGCSAAFSVDQEDGEALVVVCELAHGEEERADDVMAAVRRAITEEYELRAHAVVMVRSATVAKTPNGKIQRGLCREEYLEHRLVIVREWCADAGGGREPVTVATSTASDAGRGAPDEIERWFRRKMTAVGIDASRLRPEMGLTELGFDSVMIVELRSEIEREFGVSVHAADLFSLPTLGALAQYVMDQRQPRTAPRATAGAVMAVERAKQGKSRLQRQHLLRRGHAALPHLNMVRD